MVGDRGAAVGRSVIPVPELSRSIHSAAGCRSHGETLRARLMGSLLASLRSSRALPTLFDFEDHGFEQTAFEVKTGVHRHAMKDCDNLLFGPLVSSDGPHQDTD